MALQARREVFERYLSPRTASTDIGFSIPYQVCVYIQYLRVPPSLNTVTQARSINQEELHQLLHRVLACQSPARSSNPPNNADLILSTSASTSNAFKSSMLILSTSPTYPVQSLSPSRIPPTCRGAFASRALARLIPICSGVIADCSGSVKQGQLEMRQSQGKKAYRRQVLEVELPGSGRGCYVGLLGYFFLDVDLS